jgi:Fe-S cluster assembly ATP-binding protein
MLKIENLHAQVEGKEILKGVNLTINDGEIHALMGTNGAGKSTLSKVIVGDPFYEVTKGTILFNGHDILPMKPEERANLGIFMSFQQPIEIPGVSMTNFLKAAVNAKLKYQGKEPMKAADFLKMMREKRKLV